MSWGTCYKGGNNIHPGFPALMSSGNLNTDWNAACKNNNILKKKAGINDNYQYRQYLINNADSFIMKNQIDACESCCGCLQNFEKRPASQKFLFKSCSDSRMPFGYENSDLKNLYLSKTSLQSRLSAPIMTQSQMLQRPNWN
jgi:hypothetical protein|tara:strand:+ start:532 stop:957 length:426 start_codon:yes stop_codon:yes gene_type:complete